MNYFHYHLTEENLSILQPSAGNRKGKSVCIRTTCIFGCRSLQDENVCSECWMCRRNAVKVEFCLYLIGLPRVLHCHILHSQLSNSRELQGFYVLDSCQARTNTCDRLGHMRA